MNTNYYALSLCAAFVMSHSAPIEESYDTLLANIHDIPYAESDRILLEIPVTYVDGKNRIYTRGILDSIVGFFEDLVGEVKNVVKPNGYEIEYETSRSHYKRNGVITPIGVEQADTDEQGSYRVDHDNLIQMTVWNYSKGVPRVTKTIFKNRQALNPKLLESLTG